MNPMEGLGVRGHATAKPTMQERACQALRDAVIVGRLAPGKGIGLWAMAEVIGVGIMPVRAAIARRDVTSLKVAIEADIPDGMDLLGKSIFTQADEPVGPQSAPRRSRAGGGRA